VRAVFIIGEQDHSQNQDKMGGAKKGKGSAAMDSGVKPILTGGGHLTHKT